MAAKLHQEVVDEDFKELQRKHRELEKSEKRYRRLSDSLEQKVKEQIATIEAAQRKLYQAEKLASVGQLAAGVAHEINNPIGFVMSNLVTAKSYLENLSGFMQIVANYPDAHNLKHAWDIKDLDFVLKDFSELLDESHEGVERVARIVADLKAFSMVDSSEFMIVDINNLIETVCNITLTQIRDKVDIELNLSPLPSIRCNAGHITQVFYNLLINAAQAMNMSGVVRISTVAHNDEIIVNVEDYGPGIDETTLRHIFEPFFSTKGDSGCVGLGLSVCSDIVKAHSGHIEVTSQPGDGARFSVFLPTG